MRGCRTKSASADQNQRLTVAVRAQRSMRLETWWVFDHLLNLRALCYVRAKTWTVRGYSLLG
jgi:hypothetical protein